MKDDSKGLRRAVRLIDVVSLGVGMAVGVALFSIFAPAARLAGPGMLIAMAIATIPMIVFAIIYAFMGSAVPLSGASFAWPNRFIHPFFAFMISWTGILGTTGAMTVVALVFVRYLSMVIHLPIKPAMFVLFSLVYALNVFGIGLAARAQTVMFVLLSTVLLALIVMGAPRIDLRALIPLNPHGSLGILKAVPLLISLYLGIEAATEIGEEIRDPARTIAWGIAICIGVTLLIYFSLAFVALGVLGSERLGTSSAPLLDTAKRVFGIYAAPIVITAACLAMAKSLNVIFMVFSRYLYAMARAGVLPHWLASLHPRWRTPHIALAVAYGFCIGGLTLPADLVFLFLAVNIPTLLKYMSTCICALRVIKHSPKVYEAAVFRPRPGSLRVLASFGIFCAAIVIVAGLTADWRPYVILVIWAVIGAAYWWVRPKGVPLDHVIEDNFG